MLERQDLLQRDFLGTDEFESLERIYVHLPFSNLKRWFPEDGFYDEALNSASLMRLSEIRSLSFLSYTGENAYFGGYSHNRLHHSIVVALLCDVILRQNNFPDDDIAKGIIAGLYHDDATTAHGDATKSIDPLNLDEETHLQDVLDDDAINFLKRNKVSVEELCDIVQNDGVLGKVLDVSDRITYTMQDLEQTVGKRADVVSLDTYQMELKYLLARFPQIGDIYSTVGVDSKRGLVFFTDPQLLKAFLFIRAMLHKNLYLQPVSQGRDFLYATLLKPFYSSDGKGLINPKTLRKMTDHQLIKVLLEDCLMAGIDAGSFFGDLTSWQPDYEKFQTNREALEFASKLPTRNNTFVLGIKECKGFDPGTRYNILDKGRMPPNVVPFRDFDFPGSRQIEALNEETKGFFVYYTDISEDSRINSLIKKIREVTEITV